MIRYALLALLALPLQAQTALELADKLPAESMAAGQAVLADLVKLGEPGLTELVAALVPAGTGDDTKVRFALNGLVHYVSRPGAEAERALLSKVLLAALAARNETEIQADLLRCLQRCGGPEAVPPLAALLLDEDLSAPAAAALLSIGGDDVTAAFVKSLPQANGPVAVTMLQAVGSLGAKATANDVIRFAASDDQTVRQAAWDALSRLGDPAGMPVLLQAAASDDVRDRTVATAACLRLAERLPRGDGVRFCRELLADNGAEHQTHVAADALTTLVRLVGDAAGPDLFTAIAGPYADLRRAAADLLLALPSDAVLGDIVARAREGDPAVRAEMIRVLQLRGETSAAELILKACQDADPVVRDAALKAAATLATPEAVQAIARAAAAAQGGTSRQLAELLKQLPTERVLQPCLELWPQASPALKVVLLDLIAARGGEANRDLVLGALKDADPSVKRAAATALGAVSTTADLPELLRQYLAAPEADRGPLLQAVASTARREEDLAAQARPVHEAWAGADEAGKLALLDVWDALAGPLGIQAVQAATQDPAEPVATLANEILDGWRDSGEINLAEGRPVSADCPHQGNNLPAKAVDGNSTDKAGSSWFGSKWPSYLQVDLGAVVPLDAAQVWFYWDSRYYQYTIAVSVDGNMWRTVVDQTANTAPANADGVTHRFVATPGRYVRLNVLTNSANEAVHVVELKVYAAGTLPEPKAPEPLPMAALEEGFTPLFNGVDLTGWIGATNGYKVEDGVLVCIPEIGGKLMTEREYRNFIFRFEFKLTEGANNGVGIRAPLPGDAAYNGMEIQILDDDAERYAKLQPYQYHGSIYGVCASERGHQRPIGEWNSQEIRAWDRRVTVTLNGVVITDCDLDEARLPFTLDHKDHPGLMNEAGHIGFLGHGSRVEFRNIRIQEFPAG